jgi:DNA-binding NarL/FixJ family response regulator
LMDHSDPDGRAGLRAHPANDERLAANALIVVERREFARGCLACWIANYVSGIDVVPVGDAEADLSSDAFARCIAAIIGMEPSEQYRWLYRQIAWLRVRQPRLPIILIAESEQCRSAAELATRLDLQGYIPASSSLEVAKAAVHLVLAGGSYFPRPPNDAPQQKDLLLHNEHSGVDLAGIAELTSRERSVLVLLASGMPNKVIANRLSMSLSTVKAHVHHIIRKLKVGNRTEVALLAQYINPAIPETAELIELPSELSTTLP